MYAVGRLGSYITRSVYTVSGPFHPFGGAVDIIVVEQPDGSFKSSPWYVRFGKFQGVLRAREKVVTITVNGTDANCHMYLDQRGEAYFLREIEGEEGESISYISSSSDEMDEESLKIRRTMKSKSCYDDGIKLDSGDQIDQSSGDVARTISNQSRISRLVFGRRSTKENGYQEGGDGDGARVVRISSLDRAEIAADLVETFMLNESDMEEKLVEIAESSRNIAEPILESGDQDRNAEVVLPDVTCSDPQIADVFETCSGKKLDDKQASKDRNDVLTGFSGSQEESGSSRVQSFIYNGASEISVMGLDGLKEQSKFQITSGGPEEAHFCIETLHVTAEPLPEDSVNQQTEDINLERQHTEPCETKPSFSMRGHDEADLEVPLTVSISYSQPVHVDSVLGSVEVEPEDPVFNVNNSVDQIEDDINIGSKITMDELEPSLESAGVSGQINGDLNSAKAATVHVSESSEEEQFFFSDIDDFELRETQGDSYFPSSVDKGNHPSFCPEGIDVVNGLLNTNDGSYSSQDNFVQDNRLDDCENLTENSKLTSSPVFIPKRHNVVDAEVGRLAGSLPDLWSHTDNLGTMDSRPLSHSLDLDSDSLDWKLHSKNESHFANSDISNENKSVEDYSNKEDTHHLEDVKDGVGNPAIGDPSEAIASTGGSWRLWPFPFRRSRSRKTLQPALSDTRSSDDFVVSNGIICVDDDKNVLKGEATNKMMKAIAPTSEQLASLNLKEGSNAVTFTFSTAMLGKQKVDARIYLWKWNTRIVISDVDGTITKSDVLGQFMPLVGIDWSQNGVAHLFSAIKDNGYQFLYLSARAIAQAYLTRQFLVNLKQDGKALPDGPVVISPDGLFPSLYREVIRRAPHEFKIACLEEIKALFPSDCNPFYAGFGNRDTDEISYLKVGIPKGKIFIINPKGEVAVNRLVDTRSYTSLHALVHGMFPAYTSSEQEDYNSWNFWKLPPPDIDI
ncbi:phosphatidate phosphatase PAH2 isoform X2 [Manihot esculenta]|uniref:LNS2/PITP domain-containing protein n=1 Tax=Manihot esculenta TaxID=3983 RepID=A0A2C9VZC7_MANES|nr:phosphatidate phosphatase PAH2 isoform X2 [Manihot esculenta]OAY50915.1 hypothetical protein MANES_05G172400v8 [Manihot esculenta]